MKMNVFRPELERIFFQYRKIGKFSFTLKKTKKYIQLLLSAVHLIFLNFIKFILLGTESLTVPLYLANIFFCFLPSFHSSILPRENSKGFDRFKKIANFFYSLASCYSNEMSLDTTLLIEWQKFCPNSNNEFLRYFTFISSNNPISLHKTLFHLNNSFSEEMMSKHLIFSIAH